MSSPTIELDKEELDDSSVDSGPHHKKMKVEGSREFSIT
jgi:hypothetical protein